MKLFLCLTFALSFCLGFSLSQDNLNPFKPRVEVTCAGSESRTYNRIGQKYYIIGNSKVSWFDSLHLCRRFGGDLVSIESSVEMDTLSAHLISQGYDVNAWFWTAGNDLVIIHNFMSATNGLPLPYTSWSGGQPDLPGLERCVHLWIRDGKFRMNNWMCNERAYYICQMQNFTRCYDGY